MSNIYDLADTWNAAGTTFTAIKMNVTDTASQAASLLLDLQVAGSSKFSVTKAGAVTASSDATFGGDAVNVSASAGQLRLYSAGAVGWTAAGSASTAIDLALVRDTTDVLAQRRSTNAQTFRTYGTYTDASNYRRVALAMTTAGVATLKPEGLGTGASGNVLHISGLPTSNPGAGILWNNAGSPAIGT